MMPLSCINIKQYEIALLFHDVLFYRRQRREQSLGRIDGIFRIRDYVVGDVVTL
ncbi:MAG: hypothetical protein QG577_514 [Thermodesulfobacteriota bacterium]|nr:hypothetical protein [Thermodesulfobacteriota bacterium]